jgi:hypothetical protein
MNMEVEKINLAHRPLISRCFESLNPNISDFTFANLYLFRDICRYRLVHNGDPVIACTMKTDEPCWMPLIDLRQFSKERLIELMKAYGVLYPVPEEWIGAFSGSEFLISCNEGEMDYLYQTEKMATLKGGALVRKRNRLKNFLARHRHSATLLNNDRVEEAIDILNAWQDDTGLSGSHTDYGPCLEALRMHHSLHLDGMIYYVEKQPVGFLVGERLNSKTYVIHFAKGIKTYKGLYEHMFNDMAKRLLPKYAYMNLEEDLGKEALKITKSSYDPDNLVKKFRIRLT